MNVYFHADHTLAATLGHQVEQQGIGGLRTNTWRHELVTNDQTWHTVGLVPSMWPLVFAAGIRLDPEGAHRAPGAGRPPSWSCRSQATSGHTGRIWARHVDGREASATFAVYVRVGLIYGPPGLIMYMPSANVGEEPKVANGVLDVDVSVYPEERDLISLVGRVVSQADNRSPDGREHRGTWSLNMKAAHSAMMRWTLRQLLTGTPVARW